MTEPAGDRDDAPATAMGQQATWVDAQVQRAMARGDFDNLPGAGKPIRGLGQTSDPDWWVKSLIEREKITGVLPPALALRKEDAALDATLDREATESAVQRTVEDFNRRVQEARRQLEGGPPVVTATRDAQHEVAAWRERREQRRARQREQVGLLLPSGATEAGRGSHRSNRRGPGSTSRSVAWWPRRLSFRWPGRHSRRTNG